MKIRSITALLAGLFLFAAAHTAQAAVIWDWDFINPVQTVSPTQTVTMAARITNDAASTGNLVYPATTTFAGINPGSAYGVYDFFFGTNGADFWPQLTSMNLAPGESLDFIFGTLVPVGGLVAPGTYQLTGGSLFLGDILGGRSGKTFQVTVVGGVPVPEPATWALLLVGLLMVPFLVRKHHR